MTFSVWRFGAASRDLFIVFAASAVSIVGNEVAVIALVLQLHDDGAGSWAVAGLLIAGTIPMIMFAPVAGFLVDRYDSRTLIIASSIWQTAACALLAFVRNPAAVFILVALNGIGAAVIGPTFGVLLQRMVPRERLAAVTSLAQGVGTVAALAGPAVGGLLTGLTGGATVPMLLDAASFTALTVAGTLIRTRRKPKPGADPPRMRDGITAIVNDRALAVVAGLAVLLILVGQVVSVAEVFLVRDTFGASALVYGLLSATYTFGMLISTPLSAMLNTARRILIGIPLASAAMAISIGGVGLSPSLVLVFVLYLAAGAATAVVSTATGTLVLLRTPEAVLGRVLASLGAVLRSASLLAYGFGGMITGLVAPEVAYVLAGSATLVVVVAAAPMLRKAATAELAVASS